MRSPITQEVVDCFNTCMRMRDEAMACDMSVFVLDARSPYACRNPWVEGTGTVSSDRVAYVLLNYELVPADMAAEWTLALRSGFPASFLGLPALLEYIRSRRPLVVYVSGPLPGLVSRVAEAVDDDGFRVVAKPYPVWAVGADLLALAGPGAGVDMRAAVQFIALCTPFSVMAALDIGWFECPVFAYRQLVGGDPGGEAPRRFFECLWDGRVRFYAAPPPGLPALADPVQSLSASERGVLAGGLRLDDDPRVWLCLSSSIGLRDLQSELASRGQLREELLRRVGSAMVRRSASVAVSAAPRKPVMIGYDVDGGRNFCPSRSPRARFS